MANPDAAPEGFVRVVRVAPRTPHFGRRVESGSAAPPLAPTPTHSAGTELFRAWAASVRGYMGGREQQLQQPAVAIEQQRRVQQVGPSWPILVYGAPRSTRVKDYSMHECTSAQLLTARSLVTNGYSSSQPYKKVW